MSTHPLHVHPDHQRALEQMAAEEQCSPELLLHDLLDGQISAWQRQHAPAEVDSPAELAADVRHAEEALADYDRTGLHLTGDEVVDWLRRLKQDRSAQLPPCHL